MSKRMDHAIFLNILKPFTTLASGLGKHKKLFILIYHRVLDEPDALRPGEVDKIAFTWHMQLLAYYFNVIPLSEALEKLKENRLPARAVSITFDDGYADNFINALPILKKFNLQATFFIASGFLNGGRMWNDTIIEAIRNYHLANLDLSAIGLGNFDISDDMKKSEAINYLLKQIKHLPPIKRKEFTEYFAQLTPNLPNNLMMTDQQIIELAQSDMEIGGHTVNHPILANLDDEQAEREIYENKRYLENILNKPLHLFAYPNGKPIEDFLPEQSRIVSKVGYTAAVSTMWGVANKFTNRWILPRFTPWDATPVKFMLRLTQIYYISKINRETINEQ